MPLIDINKSKQLLRRSSELDMFTTIGRDVLKDKCGFALCVKASLLHGGGEGVFVEEGVIKRDQVAAVYPGNRILYCIFVHNYTENYTKQEPFIYHLNQYWCLQ